MRVLLAATAACLLAPAVPATAAAFPTCTAVAFSPAFGRDRTAFCLHATSDGATLRRSTNGAASWGPARRVTTQKAASASLHVSPLYATDRRVYVVAAEAVYGSTDSGATFAAVTRPTDAPLTGSRLTAYVETAGPSPRAAFAVADEAFGPARVLDTAVGVRLVPGVPAFAQRFIVPADYGTTRQAVVIASPPGVYQEDKPVNDVGTHAYACVGDFACAEQVFTFGRVGTTADGPLGRPGEWFYGGPLMPRSGPPTERDPERVWRTRDGGRTWTRWASVEKIADAHRTPDGMAYTITASPDAPRRLFLSVAKPGPTRGTFSVYRSDDDGATWRRAIARAPWNQPTPGLSYASVYAMPGGRLYALAGHRDGGRTDYTGLYCSTDNARTWRVGRC